MPFLYNLTFGEKEKQALLSGRQEIKSLIYHDLFGFPLTAGELIKWQVGDGVNLKDWQGKKIKSKAGFYFLAGNEGLVFKRLLKKRISRRKMRTAKKAAKVLGLLPTVKMIAATGALAMENAGSEADIDLLIITQKQTLWTTRFLAYFILGLSGFALRRPKDKKQQDKLCLNMWLDEAALAWPARDRNIYTAHEICQIKPLLNKNKTYEKFLAKNYWVRGFWPNAIRVQSTKCKVQRKILGTKDCVPFTWLEKFVFKMQYLYMKSKITREVISPHKAIFHPNDWGKVVLSGLQD